MLNDIRYAVRTLLKSPGFTFIAALTLALGIGANSAIFTVINAVLLRPLPYREPARLAMIWEHWPQARLNNVSPANFLDWRKQNRTFEELAACSETGYVMTASSARAGDAERLKGAAVSHNIFGLLGVRPLRGRGFLPEDDRPEASRVVILSHGLWLRDFAGDPGVLGRAVMLEGSSYTVVGVMPEGFQYPDRLTDVWTPIEREINYRNMHWRGSHYLTVVGRLKPGVTMEQARTDMTAITRQIKEANPTDFTPTAATVQPLEEHVVGKIQRILVVLFAAVGFVLLIACANVANLMLSRAAARSREIAIRTAIGAGRARIIRQLLTESVALAVAGGALGLAVAWWGTDFLVGLVPDAIPRANEIHVDARVLVFTFAVSVLTGIIFGLAPALTASKTDVNEMLKEGGRSASAGSARSRLRSALVVCEIALSLVLMIGAGLLIASFSRLTGVDPGFKPDNVLTLRLALPEPKYLDETVMRSFYGRIVERMQALPGVESASAISDLPLTGNAFDNTFTIPGRPLPPGEFTSAQMRWVSPDYFRTMGIPLLRGRGFTNRDNERSPRTIIISQAMARRYWPGDDPIGKRMVIDFRSAPDFEIVGIAGDVRSGPELEPESHMYVTYSQLPRASMYVALRARGAINSSELAAAVRREVAALDSDVAVYKIRSMEDVMALAVASRRFNMLLLGIFAGLALVLAAVGIYGVMAYAVSQRTHEIGVRMALGAQRRDVMQMLIGQGLVLALIGVAVGLAGAFGVTRVISTLLYGVSATDAPTFVIVSAVLAGVALLASYLPALRATRIQPIVALRYE